jgi:hypothetical protein
MKRKQEHENELFPEQIAARMALIAFDFPGHLEQKRG